VVAAFAPRFKGKASFEDTIGKVTLYLGVSFMALMLVIDLLGNKLDTTIK
jgi:preprotein translocase subunit SecG